MSESFFFIQNHRFLLPDLEHMDSQEIHIGAVLVKTNVLLVLPNKLAELGAVYDCLH